MVRVSLKGGGEINSGESGTAWMLGPAAVLLDWSGRQPDHLPGLWWSGVSQTRVVVARTPDQQRLGSSDHRSVQNHFGSTAVGQPDLANQPDQNLKGFRQMGIVGPTECSRISMASTSLLALILASTSVYRRGLLQRLRATLRNGFGWTKTHAARTRRCNPACVAQAVARQHLPGCRGHRIRPGGGSGRTAAGQTGSNARAVWRSCSQIAGRP